MLDEVDFGAFYETTLYEVHMCSTWPFYIQDPRLDVAVRNYNESPLDILFLNLQAAAFAHSGFY